MKNLLYVLLLTLGLLGGSKLQAKEVALTTNQRIFTAAKGLGYGTIALGNAYGIRLFTEGMISDALKEVAEIRDSKKKIQRAATNTVIIGSFIGALAWAGITAGKRSYELLKEAYAGKCTVKQEVEVTLHQTKVN